MTRGLANSARRQAPAMTLRPNSADVPTVPGHDAPFERMPGMVMISPRTQVRPGPLRPGRASGSEGQHARRYLRSRTIPVAPGGDAAATRGQVPVWAGLVTVAASPAPEGNYADQPERGGAMSDISLLKKQVEEHPCYKKLSGRAVRRFDKHKTYASEVALASTKGVREQAEGVWQRDPGIRPSAARRRHLGKKGYLLLTEGNLYWLGLRGSWDVSGLTHRSIPQQFLGAQTRVPVPGGIFFTRRFRAKHIRRFLELNNLLARLWGLTHTSAVTSPATAPPRADEITDQIAKLAALRDKGDITALEYDRKKAELLDRL